jgi:CubicO group peptidase (beta-lactamase class C family)
MTQDTVFWIASCTKLITAIAAMQLVEKNHLTLDDGDAVERFLPELASVKVLEEVPGRGVALVDKVRKITLRMLLSHTGKYSPRINWPPDG